MDSKQKVYEDFEPTMDWERNAAYDTLLVYLPGFRKEQLKVQLTSTRNLRIFGERPVGGNRLSRFRQEVRIPSHYDVNQISGKFENGVLKIKHPKSTSPAEPQEEGNEPQEEVNKPQGQKESGQEQATEEDAQKAKIDEQTAGGKINGEGNTGPASQKIDDKEKEIDATKGKSADDVTDADKVPNKTSDDQKADGSAEAGKEKCRSIHDSLHNAGKSKLGYYKQDLGGVLTQMKKPKKSIKFVVAAGLLGLLLGLYVGSAIRSKVGESEN